jgi:hypothetical protein
MTYPTLPLSDSTTAPPSVAIVLGGFLEGLTIEVTWAFDCGSLVERFELAAARAFGVFLSDEVVRHLDRSPGHLIGHVLAGEASDLSSDFTATVTMDLLTATDLSCALYGAVREARRRLAEAASMDVLPDPGAWCAFDRLDSIITGTWGR